jgi:hypothetical protein
VGAGCWAVVEWSVGSGPSFGERERQRAGSRPKDGAGQRSPVVGRSLGGQWGRGRWRERVGLGDLGMEGKFWSETRLNRTPALSSLIFGFFF